MGRLKKRAIKLLRLEADSVSYSFSIAQLNFATFCSCMNEKIDQVDISDFYDSDLRKDYETKEVMNINRLENLKTFLDSLDDFQFTLMKFFINEKNLAFSFTDNYDCTITANNQEELFKIIKILLECLGIGASLESIKTNEGSYVAVNETGTTVAIFKTFDEYLNSNFTTEIGKYA